MAGATDRHHFRTRCLASLTNAPFSAYVDGQTSPTLCEGLPLYPCFTPTCATSLRHLVSSSHSLS